MITETIKKLESAIPKLESFNLSMLTFDQMCELINALEDSSDIIDEIMTSDEDTAVADIVHVEEEIEKEAEEEEKKINPKHEDGTPKTKQEIADEKWELRQKKIAKQVDKFVSDVNKATAFVNRCIEEVSKYGTIAMSMLNISMYIDELYKQIGVLKAKMEGTAAWAELNYYIELVKIKIQKVILKIKRMLSSWEKAMWFAFYNGKLCAAMAATQAWLLAAFASIQAVVEVINNVLKMLPDMLNVPGEGMSFFMTPKNLQATHIPIVNNYKSIGSILSDIILQQIEELCSQTKKVNAIEKGTQIAANVALAQSLGEVITMDKLPIKIEVPSVELMVRKAVDAIISFLPIPNPMPKYEKLNMVINPGYLLFLVTGWCRAGQVAFGMTGYMPGIPATPPEYSPEVG